MHRKEHLQYHATESRTARQTQGVAAKEVSGGRKTPAAPPFDSKAYKPLL